MNTCRITCRQILHLQYCTFHRKRSSCLHMLLYDLNTKDNEPIRYDPVVWYVEMLWLSLWTRYVDVDDLTRPNSAILLKQVSGIRYWELLYHTENVEGCEKKIQLKYKYKRQNKHPSKTYIIYGCRLNNLETKSTHTQSPYPSKIIMISAILYTQVRPKFRLVNDLSNAGIRTGSPPPFQNKNKTIKPFIIITSRLKY